jgi:hypothetical protein
MLQREGRPACAEPLPGPRSCLQQAAADAPATRPPLHRSYGPIKAEYDTSRRTITRTNYEVGGAS